MIIFSPDSARMISPRLVLIPSCCQKCSVFTPELSSQLWFRAPPSSFPTFPIYATSPPSRPITIALFTPFPESCTYLRFFGIAVSPFRGILTTSQYCPIPFPFKQTILETCPILSLQFFHYLSRIPNSSTIRSNLRSSSSGI